MNVWTAMLDAAMTLLATAAPISELPAVPGHSFWMPERASTVAADVDWVFNFITWISIFFFIVIVALMTLFVVKYRRVEGRKTEESPTHHTPLELTWTILPLIIVIIMFYIGMQGYISLRAVPGDAYEVTVTAQRWSWSFQHRNGCMQTDTLYVPLGRPVKLVMLSEDVLHSLYIPAFRVKQDVVPGRVSTLWFEATRPGVYNLFCAEYCGTDHSQMVAQVHVLPEAEFLEAIRECAEWIDGVTQEQLHLAGARLYTQCASCHSLDGSRRVGPSLLETHDLWGQPRQMADGSTRIVDENYIIKSLDDPGSDIVATFANQMQSFRAMPQKRKFAMVEFIKRLDEFSEEDRLSLQEAQIPSWILDELARTAADAPPDEAPQEQPPPSEAREPEA